jgi:hypothetical protein
MAQALPVSGNFPNLPNNNSTIILLGDSTAKVDLNFRQQTTNVDYLSGISFAKGGCVISQLANLLISHLDRDSVLQTQLANQHGYIVIFCTNNNICSRTRVYDGYEISVSLNPAMIVANIFSDMQRAHFDISNIIRDRLRSNYKIVWSLCFLADIERYELSRDRNQLPANWVDVAPIYDPVWNLTKLHAVQRFASILNNLELGFYNHMYADAYLFNFNRLNRDTERNVYIFLKGTCHDNGKIYFRDHYLTKDGIHLSEFGFSRIWQKIRHMCNKIDKLPSHCKFGHARPAALCRPIGEFTKPRPRRRNRRNRKP